MKCLLVIEDGTKRDTLISLIEVLLRKELLTLEILEDETNADLIISDDEDYLMNLAENEGKKWLILISYKKYEIAGKYQWVDVEDISTIIPYLREINKQLEKVPTT